MKKGTKIYLEKIEESSNPLCPTPKFEDYFSGEDNGNVSIPISYNIEGVLLNDINIGQSIIALRSKRNNIEYSGLFSTSDVKTISAVDGFTMIETNNSIYRMKEI